MRKRVYLLLLMPLLVLMPETKQNFGKTTEKDELKEDLSLEQRSGTFSTYPIKTAAYWTSPTMVKSQVINLAKHDIVIVDLENKFNNRQSLLLLKALNPKITILAYSNPMEIWLTLYPNRPWQNKVIQEITTKKKPWLLTTVSTQGSKKVDFSTYWRSMTMLNMSIACPKINGETYSEWMAEKISREILSDPIFDGYFMDNGTVDVAWMHRNKNKKIDINYDGRPDPDSEVDRLWRAGVEGFLDDIYKINSQGRGFFAWLKSLFSSSGDYLIVSNKGDMYLLKWVKGKFFENFPLDYVGSTWAGGWLASIKNANRTGEYTIIQANRGNIDFVLASALLLDNAHIAVAQDDSGIFPQFNIVTGKPLGSIKRNGNIFTREYERIKVMVDPLNRKGTITHKY